MGETGFMLIPVIDLMAGQVVRGIGGERGRYRPIESPLLQGAAPLDVVAAFKDLLPFRALYIADLDAIQSRPGHLRLIGEIAARHPDLELWVDAGVATDAACAELLSMDCVTCVLGSESQTGPELLEAFPNPDRLVLSLDTKGGRPLDPAGLFERPELWPARLIAMTLARVGSDAGPDLDAVGELRARRPAARVFAAGGVRDAGDVARLAAAGAAGVLLSSALHNGGLTRETLSTLA